MSPAPELKATLTLPQTAFPMKANLPQNEPLRLARWASVRLYDELRKAGQGRPAYLLHDGPPYANGPIHLGHALNKGLKDFVVKSKTMAGFDAPYVPGYDCHGLPIEIKVDEKLGHKKLEMPVPAVLDACRAYAQKYVDLQTAQFERIGCFGRWQTPYKTMARDYEARTLEAFYGFLEKGFVYRGLKPVYWCIHDRTALAEAEVEYENHTSPSVYVRYRLTSRCGGDCTRARRPRRLHDHLDDDAVDAARVAGRGLPSRLRVRGARQTVISDRESAGLHCGRRAGRAGGRSLQARARPRSSPASRAQRSTASPSSIRFWSAASWAFWPPTSPPTPAPARCTPRPRTARTTSIPASATASTHLPRRCRRAHPRRSRRLAARRAARLRRHEGLGGESSDRGHAGRARRAAGRRAARALLSALLALPPSGHLPRHRAVVHLA